MKNNTNHIKSRNDILDEIENTLNESINLDKRRLESKSYVDELKKSWNIVYNSLPKWRKEEVDICIKTNNIDSRIFTDFVKQVDATAEQNLLAS